MPARPLATTVRVAAAVAALTTGLGAAGGIGSPASAAGLPRTSVAAPRAAVGAAPVVRIPSTCRAAVTLVRPDTTLALGVVQGTKATLYDTGRRLGYTPSAVAYLGNVSSGGATVDRFLAVDAAGRLHRVVISQGSRTAAATSTDTVVGRGWGGIRTLVSSGPYLYGISRSGALYRYAVTKAYGIVGAGTVARRGWGTVTSLAYGGWWNLGGGRVAEDLVGLTRSGAVLAYVVPRSAPIRVSARTLEASGWHIFRHVAVGECSRGNGRPIVGVRPGGDVYAYLDADRNDQSGRDIRPVGRVARGWTGQVFD